MFDYVSSKLLYYTLNTAVYGAIVLSPPGILVGSLLAFSSSGISDREVSAYCEHLNERNKEFGEKISEQVGLHDFTPISVRFEKNDQGAYDLRIFGNAKDDMYGDEYSVMKNVTYTNISEQQINDYSQALQNLLDDKFSNSEYVDGKVVSANWVDNHYMIYNYAFQDLWNEWENFKRKADEIYTVLYNSTTEYYTVDSIGFPSEYLQILQEEYKFNKDALPNLDQTIDGELDGWQNHYNLDATIKAEYATDRFILTDVAPVTKENGYYYVPVNTIQVDEQDKLFNIRGCFVVEGENLTNQEVYQKIENKEYSKFALGDRQHEKDPDMKENDLCM